MECGSTKGEDSLLQGAPSLAGETQALPSGRSAHTHTHTVYRSYTPRNPQASAESATGLSADVVILAGLECSELGGVIFRGR